MGVASRFVNGTRVVSHQPFKQSERVQVQFCEPEAPPAADRSIGSKVQVSYLMCTPEMARAMISRWISLVPSKMV
jgi:hypothetical protein